MNGHEAETQTPQAWEARKRPQALMLACVNSVLRHGPKQPAAGEDMAALYRLSKAHGLQVLVFDALRWEGADPATLAAWTRDIQQNYLYDLLLRQEHLRVQAALREAAIGFMPLKGIALKDLYPQSSYRVTADLDYYVPHMDLPAVTRVMEGLGYSADDYGLSYHAGFSNQSGLHVEMHRALVSRGHEFEGLARYLEGRVRTEEGAPRWSREDEYLYLLMHLAKHLIRAGVGVRQVLDVCLFQEGAGPDRSYLRDVLKRFDLLTFEENVQALIALWFHGTPTANPRVRDLADAILCAGSFGSVEGIMAYNVQKGLRRYGGRLGYLFRRMFPGRDFMCDRYPAAGWRLVFMPAFWAHRLVAMGIAHRRRMLREIWAVFGKGERTRPSNDRFFH
ncbi:MAG: nucleotidyltransferase family protein [Clostridiales bacterium]|nr:nucleotidyltransferase family protein [Clostridiales bacterium]